MRKLALLAVLLFSIQSFAAITGIAVSASTQTTSTITWTTTAAETSQVVYGLNGQTNLATLIDSRQVTSHSITVTGLIAGQVYTYKVVSGPETSSSNTFSLCSAGIPNSGFTNVTGTVNVAYGQGQVSAAWVNDSGVSTSTPTVCGASFQTTVSSTLTPDGNLSVRLPDNNLIIPSPGRWALTVKNATGNIGAFTVTTPIAGPSVGLSSQLQAAAAGNLQLVYYDANTTTYDPTGGGTGGGGSGVLVLTGADPSGNTDSLAAFRAAVTSVITSNLCLYVPQGTYKVSASIAPSTSNFCMLGAGSDVTSITASSSGYNTLIVGPGSVGYVGPSGHISDIAINGAGIASDGHSALQLNGVVQYDLLRVNLGNADIGLDAINNNYGSQCRFCRIGFGGTVNVGVNLRTGAQSGSDWSFPNSWIAGVVASISMSGGGGGWHIHDGQLAAGIGLGSPSDTSGVVIIGKDYLTGTLGEVTATLDGVSFEGCNDVWALRTYNQVNLVMNGVAANPSDASHPCIGFFKGTTMQNTRVVLTGTTLSGNWSAANMLSFAGGNAGYKFWDENFTYSGASNPVINGVSTYVFSMAAQSGILQQAAVVDSNVTRTFYAQQYPGATIDVQVNACLADALAVGGTCDASALGAVNVVANGHPNPQTLAAQIVVGDNNGDPVKLILPVSFWWEGTMTDGTSCDVKQFSGTSIVSANVTSAMPSMAAFVSATTSSLNALFCIVQSTGQGAGNYVYDQGFQINNGQYSGFGAVTVSGAGMLIQAGHLDDVSKFDHVIVGDKLDAYAVELTNSVCCSTTLDGIQINGLQVSTPLFIDAESGFGMSAVHIVNSSIVHNGTNLPLIQITDNGSHTAVVDITNLYSEVYPATGGIIAIAGAGAVSLTNIDLKAYSGSMTSPAITVTNTVNTHLQVNNLNLTNGSGSWTEPCTQAIVDNFLSQTIPCLSITGVGYVGHYDTDPRFNNLRFQGGFGLGTNGKNLALGDSTTLPSASLTGQNNICIGAASCSAITSGSSSVVLGTGAVPALLSGQVTAVGTNAGTGGVSLTTVSTCNFFGDGTGAQTDGISNCSAFGHGATVVASNTTTIGNASTTDVYLGSNGATQVSKANLHANSVFEADSGGFGSSWQGGSSACETSFAPTTLATGATATDTGLNCLPANSIIDAVVARVTTTITSACTGWELGDATTPARFSSNNTVLTAGTTTDAAHIGTFNNSGIASATTGIWQATAAKVRITCAGGDPGAGAIRVIVYSHSPTAPTS